MGLRPGRCYRTPHKPFTRVSVTKPRKSYIKGVPKHKIQQFQTRETRPEQFEKVVHLVSEGNVQIRDNSLESARMSATRALEKKIGPGLFFLRLRPYPHHVLRENPLATGAGADRFQQGMRQSFGNPIGTAAQVRENQTLMEAFVHLEHLRFAKEALNAARYKLPVKCRVIVAK